MTLSLPSVGNRDLRKEPIDLPVSRVERSLGVAIDPASIVRKRRSVGGATDRGTWVRIERRPLSRIEAQGWSGGESVLGLRGVAAPKWLAGLAWLDQEEEAGWRADETTLLPSPPVGNAVLAENPELPKKWWRDLNTSLDALATARTTRVATPDTETITPELITSSIHTAFGARVTVPTDDWVPAHADLNWANMSAPSFCLFDWEDWGNAPRGLDASSLWAASLAVPELAARVLHERRADLTSATGKAMMLLACSKFAGPDAYPDDPRVGVARTEAARLVGELLAA